MHHLLSMGGYGAYVWTAYGITLCVFGFNIANAWREKIRVKKIIRSFLSRQHES